MDRIGLGRVLWVGCTVHPCRGGAAGWEGRSVNDRIKVTDSRQVRGVTFLQHGQRFEGWLPVGVWQSAGLCTITGGRDDTTHTPALMLTACGAGAWGKWYIGLPAAKELGFAVEIDNAQAT